MVACCVKYDVLQQNGVFRSQHNGSFEQTMRSMRFFQPCETKLKRKSPQLKTAKDTSILPPLVQRPMVQGPFRAPEEVWKQRVKPLSPTLRVSTSYNSKEIARHV